MSLAPAVIDSLDPLESKLIYNMVKGIATFCKYSTKAIFLTIVELNKSWLVSELYEENTALIKI